jgi:hypothetical protein
MAGKANTKKKEVIDGLSVKPIPLRFSFREKFVEARVECVPPDPAVFERAPAPDECWLLCAKAFAESDPDRAIAAYQHATAINPGAAHRVNRTWRLADLLKEHGFGG